MGLGRLLNYFSQPGVARPQPQRGKASGNMNIIFRRRYLYSGNIFSSRTGGVELIAAGASIAGSASARVRTAGDCGLGQMALAAAKCCLINLTTHLPFA